MRITSEHIAIAEKAAMPYCKRLPIHADDLISVAYLRLVETANKDDGRGRFNGYLYYQCKYAVIDYIRSNSIGKLGGHWPYSLDAYDGERADAIVNWSLKTIPVARSFDRSTKHGSFNEKKTHCVNGHEFTPENTRTRKDRVGRRCVTCSRGQNGRNSVSVRQSVGLATVEGLLRKEKAKLKLRIAEMNLEIVDIDAEMAKCNKLLKNEK